MNDTRRGFLKTLGKLGAVLGLTFAACSAHHSHHPHHPHPHHRKHPPKANSHTTQQAKTQDGTPVVTYGAGFSGFKRHDPVTAAQAAIDALAQARIDNAAQAIHPHFMSNLNVHFSSPRNVGVLKGITD